MYDSVVTCDEIIDAEAKYNDEAKLNDEETKTFPIDFNENNITYKTPNFCILLNLLLITIALLIAVRIYSYLIKCRPKRKHFLPFHSTKTELQEPMY